MFRVDEHEEHPLQRSITKLALLADERVLAVAAGHQNGGTRIVYVDTNVRGHAGIHLIGDIHWLCIYMTALSDGGIVLGALLPDGRLVTGGLDGWIKMWKGPWSLPACRHFAWKRRAPAVLAWSRAHVAAAHFDNSI